MGDYSLDDFNGAGRYQAYIEKDGYLHEMLMSTYNRNVPHCGVTRGGWVCTRAEDHDGPHIAHKTNQVVGIWKNEESSMLTLDDDIEKPVAVERSTAIHDPWGWTMGDEDE